MHSSRRGSNAGFAQTRLGTGGARGRRVWPEPRVLSDPRDAGAVWRWPAVGPAGPDRAGHLVGWGTFGVPVVARPVVPARLGGRIAGLAGGLALADGGGRGDQGLGALADHGAAANRGRPDLWRAAELAGTGLPLAVCVLAAGHPGAQHDRRIRRGPNRGVKARRAFIVASGVAALCADADFRGRCGAPRD